MMSSGELTLAPAPALKSCAGPRVLASDCGCASPVAGGTECSAEYDVCASRDDGRNGWQLLFLTAAPVTATTQHGEQAGAQV